MQCSCSKLVSALALVPNFRFLVYVHLVHLFIKFLSLSFDFWRSVYDSYYFYRNLNWLQVEENVFNLLVATALVQDTVSDWKCVLCRNI